MSAWIVSKPHIDALVTALCAYELILAKDADEVGRSLWLENVASIHDRYPDTAESDTGYPGPIDFVRTDAANYVFEPIEGEVDPVLIKEAADSFEYQSMEHAGWSSSRACELMLHLVESCSKQSISYNKRRGNVGSFPQDSHAYAWGIEHRDVFLAAAEFRSQLNEARNV